MRYELVWLKDGQPTNHRFPWHLGGDDLVRQVKKAVAATGEHSGVVGEYLYRPAGPEEWDKDGLYWLRGTTPGKCALHWMIRSYGHDRISDTQWTPESGVRAPREGDRVILSRCGDQIQIDFRVPPVGGRFAAHAGCLAEELHQRRVDAFAMGEMRFARVSIHRARDLGDPWDSGHEVGVFVRLEDAVPTPPLRGKIVHGEPGPCYADRLA